MGYLLALPFAWAAAGGWEGMRAAAGEGATGTYGSLTGMGVARILGLAAWWWVGAAGLGSLVLALTVGPRMRAVAAEQKLSTVGDFLEWRFARSVRVLIAAVLWLGTLALLAGQLIAIALALEVIAGLPRAYGALIASVVLVLYFSGGGLLASAWVNLLQLVTLLVGLDRPLVGRRCGAAEMVGRSPEERACRAPRSRD